MDSTYDAWNHLGALARSRTNVGRNDRILKTILVPKFMILLFILYHLFHVLARPVPTTSDISFYPRKIDPNRFTQRSEWNIIWGCFATLFICSWVAIHPNIPAKSDKFIRKFFRRLMIMAYMFIVPEVVIYWASRQWYAARYIANKHKDRRWSRTHGFFASMGGFMLCDENDNMIETLSIERLEDLASEGKIRWPSISTDEIEDKSKGDAFSKGFAVIQTTWFITQCIVRGAYRLPITELEVATLAFAALNGALYFLWWNKPQDVACPVPVYLHHSSSKQEAGTQTTDSEDRDNPNHDLSPIHPDSLALNSGDKDLSHKNDPVLATNPVESRSSELHSSIFARFSTYCWRLGNMVLLPIRMLWLPVWRMIECDGLTGSPPLSVPTFYAPSIDEELYDGIIAIIVGVLFGGIHCTAWSFRFQSVEEKYIWRISAVIITAIPLTWASLGALGLFFIYIKSDSEYDHDPHPKVDSSQPSFFWTFLGEIVVFTLFFFVLVAYFISRAALLVLPLIALRSLPPESLIDINWSSFIPHIY